MRIFVFILSLIILFQSASWAMPMSEHHHMGSSSDDHISMSVNESMQSHSAHLESYSQILSTVNEHCEQEIAEHINQGGLEVEQSVSASCLVNCLIACGATSGLLDHIPTVWQFHYTNVAFLGHISSFTSRTESPEIRPPHIVYS